MGGSLTEQEILKVKNHSDETKKIQNFIETGTYKADTTILASKFFSQVYTTEIFEPLYLESMNRAKNENITNINFLLGDSISLLENKIMPNITCGSVYFIDAHISGADSSWNHKNRVPLLEELDIILKYEIKPSVFIFDDVRFWKDKKEAAWDWASISISVILERFINKKIEIDLFYEDNDRFFVFTK